MIKKLLLTLIITTFWASAQNLTMSQLVAIKNMNIAQAEEYLTAKGWKLLEAKAPKEGKLGNMTFAYDLNEYDNKAVAFVSIFFYDNEYIIEMFIQTVREEKYNEYLYQIKKWGAKFYDSYIEDGILIKIYKGIRMTFMVEISTQQRGSDFINYSDITIYVIRIINTETFNRYLDTKRNQ